VNIFDRERFGAGTLPIWVHNEHRARWRFATRHVKGKIVADCACGVGLGSAMFAQAGARHVYGFDLSEEAVNTARKNCAQFPFVAIEQGDGCKLPLDDNSIDLFISFETIEHIHDDRGFLAEVKRVLRPNGNFICSTPNRSVTMPGKKFSDVPWNPFHVREYNQGEFQALLEEHFASVHMFGQNPTPAWRVRSLEMIGRLFPGHAGGRINSALKLPRLAYDKENHHAVGELPSNGTCEYLIAFCSNPSKADCKHEKWQQ
jgi:ubiquinone/menaquinone biosynthesis C-methylase UbiE